ncbi:hypothetical protein PLEOSDRAFT_174112 [Pleurotus ostreatus PC15]|uniref:Uncharacterized protein n=1 Tax=Pleurotus ostreatus (strain PC15) TaxID=1137138 RepID=A0A067NSC9_PLEO1|nr:hypothetical protein PLEOSDRAFT_174112 [Pleurotus ostreatus PC15]
MNSASRTRRTQIFSYLQGAPRRRVVTTTTTKTSLLVRFREVNTPLLGMNKRGISNVDMLAQWLTARDVDKPREIVGNRQRNEHTVIPCRLTKQSGPSTRSPIQYYTGMHQLSSSQLAGPLATVLCRTSTPPTSSTRMSTRWSLRWGMSAAPSIRRSASTRVVQSLIHDYGAATLDKRRIDIDIDCGINRNLVPNERIPHVVAYCRLQAYPARHSRFVLVGDCGTTHDSRGGMTKPTPLSSMLSCWTTLSASSASSLIHYTTRLWPGLIRHAHVDVGG